MNPERQAHFHRVHGHFTFFLRRVALLMVIILSLARGDDAARVPHRTRSGYVTTYQLDAGWNLIGINLNLDEASKDLLMDKGALALDQKSKAYAGNGNLAPSQACWIFCQTSETITLSGNLPPEDFEFTTRLQPGWNFVGPLSGSTLSGDGTVAWGWDGQRFYRTGLLLAGHGYFLYWSGGQVASPADTYLVVDLSEGASANSYPVSYRAVPPAEGWTEEYKTTKLVLRKIPAGTFMMGSPEGEFGRNDATETLHQVTLTKDFYAGVFEVTQKQWERVMGNWPSSFQNLAYRDSRPVEKVCYNDIRGNNAGTSWPASNAVDTDSFLGRLQGKTGLPFDLPTEAQWEYACRAGTTTALNSGKDLTNKYSNCPNMTKVGRYGRGYDLPGSDTSGGTNTVGSHQPNQWGLYDMHGNVEEWCLDWWIGSDYLGEATTDPKGAVNGSSRVTRGGCWDAYASFCRSAARRGNKPSTGRVFDVGFRLVTAPPETTYLIVDLSAGPEATTYPISYRAAPPTGGWTDEYKTTKLVLRKIPAGTFVMGSPEDELGRLDSETQHQVTLTKDFYVGLFEVSQKQWNLVMGNWPSYFKNESFRDARPVEQVSYNDIRGNNAGSGWPANNAVDAASFLGRLRGKTGLDFDLPTEAQWEYACRAGTTTALNSGKNLTSAWQKCPNMDEVGRYGFNSGSDEANGDTSVGTAKVGSYKPNHWGLYDMHGNAREWCLDWWNGSDYLGETATDPKGNASGHFRACRGSSWQNVAANCRSASRTLFTPSDKLSCMGFRIAKVAP